MKLLQSEKVSHDPKLIYTLFQTGEHMILLLETTNIGAWRWLVSTRFQEMALTLELELGQSMSGMQRLSEMEMGGSSL